MTPSRRTYAQRYSVALVRHDGPTPGLNEIPSTFEIVRELAAGLTFVLADAIAIGESHRLKRDGEHGLSAVALPPGFAA